MVRPRITNSLKGSLGELYYKEYCDQKGWAYISLENIHNSIFENNELVFKKGFHRIRIKIPDEIIDEIKGVSEPTNNSEENPSFVFDFLACKVGNFTEFSGITANPYFCWVEIKTGSSGLSQNQEAMLNEIDLPIAIFHIEDVLVPPEEIEMSYDIGYGDEWEPEDSDDDY